MDPRLIFWPIIAMLILVAIVMARMFFERVAQVKREGIRISEIRSASQMATRFKDTRAADNFRNLFEVPVLFYLALLVAFVTFQVSLITLTLAWAYVALRYLHSYVHCTNNRLRYRMPVYFASFAMLLIFWAVLAVGIAR
jgi:hypothetical protein